MIRRIGAAAALGIGLLWMGGCGERTDSSVADSNMFRAADNVSAASMAQPPAMPAKQKAIPEDERHGIVYQGYLWKDLRLNEFDSYPLSSLCRDLYVPMDELDNPEEYRDIVVPYRIRIGSGSEAVTLTLDTGDAESAARMKYPEGATASYTASRDGKKLILAKPPFVYRGSGPYIDLETFVRLANLRVDMRNGQARIGGDEEDGGGSRPSGGDAADLRGKVLFNGELRLEDGEKAHVRLVYTYDSASTPRYRSIELSVDDRRVELFDETKRGNADYYENGSVETVEAAGRTYLQVRLDEDTFVLERTDDGWRAVFDPSDYNAILRGLELRVSGDGSACWVDSASGTERPVTVSDGTSNAVYPMALQGFGHAAVDDNSGTLRVTADVGAWNGSRFFFTAQIVFAYDGERFMPVSVAAWDEQRYGNDKQAGKDIPSMDDYLLFDY